jgi:hypothetical protein
MIGPTQDLTVKVKEGEEEIAQLRKHLADYSVKVNHLHVKVTLLYFPFLASVDHKQLLTGSSNTR